MKDNQIEEDEDRTARQTDWSPYDPGSGEGLPGQTGRIFEPIDGPTSYLRVPKLTEETVRILEQPRPALELPSETIWRAAACPTGKDPESEVEELAKNQFDAEPVRASQRATSLAVLKATDELQKTEAEVRERLGRERLHATHLEKVPCISSAKPPILPRIVAAGGLLFYLTLFLLSLLAEGRNAVWLVQIAIPDFENDWVGAACLSLIYVIGPCVLYKLLTHGLTNEKRNRLHFWLKLIGVPLCLGGLGIFAWKMGLGPDPVPIDKALPWEPPFWAVVATSMLLLAGTVMILPVLMDSAIDRLGSHQVTETEMFVVTSSRLLERNAVFAELVALRVRLEAIGTVLDAERADFVSTALAELRFARAQLDARIRSAIQSPHSSSRASLTHATSGLLDSDR